MTPAQSENVLKQRLGRPLDKIIPRDGITAMCAFYKDQRAEGAEIDEDGDMLLCEWGVFSFGEPESFQWGVTRQFMVTDEDEPYQLILTFHYEPTDAMRALGDGSEWCHSPDDLADFLESIESSAAFQAVADAKPRRVELRFEQC